MIKVNISFKYNLLKILDGPFLDDFHRFSCWQNIHKIMIFIIKMKIIILKKLVQWFKTGGAGCGYSESRGSRSTLRACY